MNPALFQAFLQAALGLPPEAQARIGAYIFKEIQEAMQPPVTYTVRIRTGKVHTMISTVKAIREVTLCSLKAAKTLHDAALEKEVAILVTLDRHAADHARRRLLEAGAAAEVFHDRAPPVYPLPTTYHAPTAPLAVPREGVPA